MYSKVCCLFVSMEASYAIVSTGAPFVPCKTGGGGGVTCFIFRRWPYFGPPRVSVLFLLLCMLACLVTCPSSSFCLSTFTTSSTAAGFDGFTAAAASSFFSRCFAIRSCCTGSRAPRCATSLMVRPRNPTLGFVVFGARTGVERRIKRPPATVPCRRGYDCQRRNLRSISAGRSRRGRPAVTDQRHLSQQQPVAHVRIYRFLDQFW